VQHRYFGTDRIDVRVEQGYEIGRPSRIYLKARQHGEGIHAEVGGKVIAIAQGALL
jgi:trans-2,3-dihydro-3-hydroxyanthranilate isomerase